MISDLFRFRVFNGYRPKKPRGVLRKAKSILYSARKFEFRRNFDQEDWADYGHEHLDWDGIGNFSPKIRMITFEAHSRVFAAFATKFSEFNIPFQLFLSLPIEDAEQDAVYYHTPNPQSSFPAEFDDVEWGVPELERLFSGFLPEFEFVAGRRAFNFIVWAKGVGVPLCTPASA